MIDKRKWCVNKVLRGGIMIKILKKLGKVPKGGGVEIKVIE